MMKRVTILVGMMVLMLALTACSSAQNSTNQTISEPSEPEQTQPETAVTEDPVQTTKNEISAKPQLIEFYADW